MCCLTSALKRPGDASLVPSLGGRSLASFPRLAGLGAGAIIARNARAQFLGHGRVKGLRASLRLEANI